MTSILPPSIEKTSLGFGAKNPSPIKAFSLVEVVFAIAICAFVLIAILGLFTTGMQSSRESEQEIQAANLASTLIALRSASPTNAIGANFAIPAYNMTNSYAQAETGAYVGSDGQIKASASAAVYLLSCWAGTNSTTGNGVAQVYIMLSWPPQVNSANAAGRYETVTYIPNR